MAQQIQSELGSGQAGKDQSDRQRSNLTEIGQVKQDTFRID